MDDEGDRLTQYHSTTLSPLHEQEEYETNDDDDDDDDDGHSDDQHNDNDNDNDDRFNTNPTTRTRNHNDSTASIDHEGGIPNFNNTNKYNNNENQNTFHQSQQTIATTASVTHLSHNSSLQQDENMESMAEFNLSGKSWNHSVSTTSDNTTTDTPSKKKQGRYSIDSQILFADDAKDEINQLAELIKEDDISNDDDDNNNRMQDYDDNDSEHHTMDSTSLNDQTNYSTTNRSNDDDDDGNNTMNANSTAHDSTTNNSKTDRSDDYDTTNDGSVNDSTTNENYSRTDRSDDDTGDDMYAASSVDYNTSSGGSNGYSSTGHTNGDDDDDTADNITHSHNNDASAASGGDHSYGEHEKPKRRNSSLHDHFQRQQQQQQQEEFEQEYTEQLKGDDDFPILLTDAPTPWSRAGRNGGGGSRLSFDDTKSLHSYEELNIIPSTSPAASADPHSHHTVRTTNSVPHPPNIGRETSTSSFSANAGVSMTSLLGYDHDGNASYYSNNSFEGNRYRNSSSRYNNEQNASVTFGETTDAAESVGTYQSKTSYSSKSPGSAMRSKRRWTRNEASPSSKGSSSNAKQIGMDGAVTDIPLVPDSTINFTRTSSTSIEELKDGPSPVETAPRIRRPDSRDSTFSAEVDIGDMSTDDDDEATRNAPIVVWNIELPTWLSQGPPPLHKISAAFVRNAPCFWIGCGNKLQRSSTDRAILTRLNVLCSFWTVAQLGAALYLASTLLFLDDEPGPFKGFTPHFWNLNGAVFSIGALGCLLMIISFCTIRVIRMVDLVGAIRYLWAVLWIMPAEVFFTISLFDYHRVTIVWIQHWWQERTLSWFREQYCEDGTAHTLCIVPIDGGPDYATEDDWCMALHNSTECTDIRDDAQDTMEYSLIIFYTCMGAWGICLLVLLVFMINSLERIITKPIVQKSRETNVPAWLTLPTAGCALVGAIFRYSPSSLLSSSSGADNSWVGLLYLVASGLFMIAALAGWFLSAFSIRRSADKRWKNFAVTLFIGLMAANAVILATIFVSSLTFSGNLGTNVVNEKDRGNVACFVDRSVSCTKCDAENPQDRCPEWSLGEVTQLLQTQLKQSASLAAIFIVYAISVLRFGIVLRKHLSLYQIEYV
eukprot:CAMPEP_0119551834 /NCGR_PEP_ID=MMETSP1352-20130426/4968_1 /TAXON_ID=265584 /ORGANISM="Stauroneis constricta, Strain CCMP1120" /LENGTH=1110 /DNA_ID=CAMNT_0007597951 /DNA_START=132 /DNA_END=3464 /DNA_ORIENTATION=+